MHDGIEGMFLEDFGEFLVLHKVEFVEGCLWVDQSSNAFG